ncbi:DUF669 domain-containing protein, partial [Paucilactobacillus sp. N302-9]
AAEIPEGTQLGSIEDFMNAIANKPVLVYVKKEPNEYQGKTTDVNQVAPWNFSKTKFESVQHTWANKSGSMKDNGKPIEISSDDLPF